VTTKLPANYKSKGLPANYKPEKGLKAIAEAKQAAEQCKRALDFDGMERAIAKQLYEEAKYVICRDGIMAAVKSRRMKEVGPGPGRGKKGQKGKNYNRENAAKVFPELPKADPGQDMVDRWRKQLCSKGMGQSLTRIRCG
jgi:hypothetical protein